MNAAAYAPPPPARFVAPPPAPHTATSQTSGVSAETLALARGRVRDLLSSSPAFRAMPPAQQMEIAHHTVELASYLAEPEGIKANRLPTAQALADTARRTNQRSGSADQGTFVAQGAREGAAVAGALLQAVNFPTFVSSLVTGVFHSIVESSMKQMEAYGKLVADVSKTLNQFRDDNVSDNNGRDHLVDQFPDLFEISTDSADPFSTDGTNNGGTSGPKVKLRDGVDETAALQRVNQMPLEGGPVHSLDDQTIEGKLVPAARTQLATSRQQLLATMVLMGINRIIVTDGRISAKVLYDFQARDNFRFRRSATQFDYGNQYVYKGTGTSEVDQQGGSHNVSTNKDGSSTNDRDYGSYYAKGSYQYENSPVLTLQAATQAATDAALQTKASLAGQVEINFKSETFPLEKLADSFQIGRIQDAAKPAAPTQTGTAQPTAATPPATATQPAAPSPAPTTTPIR